MKACFPIDILGSPLCSVDSVTNWGVWFDSDFSLSKHFQNVCKSCFVKLYDFRHVRQFLTHEFSVLVANALVSSQLDYCNSLFRSLSKLLALVSSQLDYCNSLFRSLSKFNLHKLQCIQNSAAKTVQPKLYQTPVNTPV